MSVSVGGHVSGHLSVHACVCVCMSARVREHQSKVAWTESQ